LNRLRLGEVSVLERLFNWVMEVNENIKKLVKNLAGYLGLEFILVWDV
jgi:hypothetical protein